MLFALIIGLYLGKKVDLRASRDVKSQFELHAKASPFHEHQKEEIPKDRMTEYALSYR